MRRNGEPAPFVNDLANFASRFAFQIRQGRADAKQMTFIRRHFLPGDDQEAIDRQSVLPHQALVEHVGDRIAGVVIGYGETMQTLGLGGRNVVLRAGDSIARKERMGVEVDVEGHCREGNFRRKKWKASVSRNGLWFAKRSVAVSRV